MKPQSRMAPLPFGIWPEAICLSWPTGVARSLRCTQILQALPAKWRRVLSLRPLTSRNIGGLALNISNAYFCKKYNTEQHHKKLIKYGQCNRPRQTEITKGKQQRIRENRSSKRPAADP